MHVLATGYEVNDREVEFESGKVKNCHFSIIVHTGSGAHPVSY
jgi:hypothetical protein